MEQIFKNILEKENVKQVENEVEEFKIEQDVDSVFEQNPEFVKTVYEALGFSNNSIKSFQENVNYLYHRTMKKKAKSILANGFMPKPDGVARIESGNGIYTVTNLEDSNNPYNKKHYGNYIVRIGYDASKIEWEYGKKIDFMKLAKEGSHGNRQYDIKDVGKVAVLHDVDKIVSVELSKDNGKTWEKSLFYNNQATPQLEQQAKQLYSQYLKTLSNKKTVTKKGFIDFIKNKDIPDS